MNKYFLAAVIGCLLVCHACVVLVQGCTPDRAPARAPLRTCSAVQPGDLVIMHRVADLPAEGPPQSRAAGTRTKDSTGPAARPAPPHTSDSSPPPAETTGPPTWLSSDLLGNDATETARPAAANAPGETPHPAGLGWVVDRTPQWQLYQGRWWWWDGRGWTLPQASAAGGCPGGNCPVPRSGGCPGGRCFRP